MTNISICNQFTENTKYGKYLRDGEKVAIRYRDENGIRKTEYHNQYPSFYINPRSFWYYDKHGVKRQVGDHHEIIEWLSGEERVVSYQEEGQTVKNTPLLKVEVKSRSHVRSFLRNYGPLYGADLDQQDQENRRHRRSRSDLTPRGARLQAEEGTADHQRRRPRYLAGTAIRSVTRADAATFEEEGHL